MVTDSGGKPAIDYMKLGNAVRTAARFLDDVIDVSRYPLEQIDAMVRGNRKIGLGVMGFADMLIALEIAYDSEQAISIAEEVMKFIETEARQMSAELAAERGPFPNFEGSIYDVPDGVKMRNATVTTIAPTGTLSIIAGCSSGIEPLFAIAYVRTVLDGTELVEVNPLFERVCTDRGFYSEGLMKEIARRGTVRSLGDVPADAQRVFATAHDIAPVWHVKMQGAFQKHTDNAVSKTVNFPNSATTDDVAEVYRLAYRLGCKGVTVYRDGSRDEQVLTVGTKKKDAAPAGEPGVLAPRPRPTRTYGVTEKVKTGCGSLYVTINEDEEGLCEVFARMGKSGGCASSQLDAVSRVISAALRAGVRPESIIKQLRGNVCPSPCWDQGGKVLSCPDAIGIALEHYMQYKQTGQATETVSKWSSTLDNLVGACPDCGSAVEHESGCIVCRFCGFSKCG
jgi:ribonucleoside-diphosphate reductase alpha chain